MPARISPGRGHFAPSRWAAAIFAIAMLISAPVAAQERAQVFVTQEQGFGRLVFEFPERHDLPSYELRSENGVLSIEFETALDLFLPDIAVTLPDYVTIARIDPDRKGVRLGLRTTLTINPMEAGEKLFVDLMPLSWQGLPPGLPAQVVADLAERARNAAVLAEQRRKEEEAVSLKPAATVRVGRNPTFVRIQFDWSQEAEAKFSVADGLAHLDFDWPVPIDLYALQAEMPAELTQVASTVSPGGSRVTFALGEGVEPRFYATSPTQFIIDIDTAPAAEPVPPAIAVVEAGLSPAPPPPEGSAEAAAPASEIAAEPPEQTEIVPFVTTIGDTVRLVFPFDRDVAAAAFRRGDSLWLLFDTTTQIKEPTTAESLGSLTSGFSLVAAGETQIVRLELTTERLASLGSEGRSWVLSLGDVLLNPTEPLLLERRRDVLGKYEFVADLGRPHRVHEFRDPVVGDLLTVVTAFPPARGATRSLDYVDFDVLRSVHGLAIRPAHEDLELAIEAGAIVLRSKAGLALSSEEQVLALQPQVASALRPAFVNLGALREDDPSALVSRREALMTKAAEAEAAQRDAARLELAQFYLAQELAHEAIGVLRVLEAELMTPELRPAVRLTRAIADTLAARPADAMAILGAEAYADDADALIWRTLARVGMRDFAGARGDALAGEQVVQAYPLWVRTRFLLAALRAAIETQDIELARRYLELIDFPKLDLEQATQYHLLAGRIAEATGNLDEALDTYGQVIAAEIRPTRAEAVYRTMRLLEEAGRIDLAKATQTLSAEAMLWRGDALEADMLGLLARLYFDNKDYRLGFETVRHAVMFAPESQTAAQLQEKSQAVFTDLYLNGFADSLEPVEALTLYYDFRELTPAGARGDEMIRNLARRLLDLDLLAQAGDLLEYQIDNRLEGAARAQVAVELALIRLAQRNPESALRVLNRTRLADLSPSVERQRRLLEARALIDAGREDLAIDLLARLEGEDADLLRVDGLWKGKRYAAAAELLEMLNPPGEGGLSQQDRMSIIKAAVGYVLGNDRLGLSRLRSKFGEVLSTTPEFPMFEFVTGEVETQSVEFRKVAREVSGIDSLNAFLATYRALYGKTGDLAPDQAAPADEAS